MFSRRKGMVLSSVAISALLLGACGGGNDSADAAGGEGEYTATMRLATVIEPDHPYNVGAREFADRIAEATDGRIEIEVFDSGQLGAGERELLEGLQQGTVDLTVVSSGPVSGFSESILAFDLPFLFRDDAHVDAVMDGDIGRQVLDDFEQADIKGLALWENGFRHLSNDIRPVVSPEDAEGLRLRTMENPVHLDTWKAFGTDPTPMSFGELYTALQQGVVDGQENPVPVFVAAGFEEVQKHLSLTGHFYSPAPIAMSLQRFEEMPEEDQQLFLDTALDVAAFERDLVRTQSEEELPALEEAGVEIVHADEIDQDKWQQAASGVYESWADRIGQDVIDAILATE